MQTYEMGDKVLTQHVETSDSKNPSILNVPGVNVDDEAPVSYTPKEENRVRWKMDLYMMPLLCFMNMCSYLDKANIGNANTAGMTTDLGLTDSQYTLLLTVFYIVYACCQWEMMLLKVVPPKIWLTFVVFVWGLASTLQGVCTSFGGVMACRVVIAVMEAGGGPAISLYLSLMYPRKEYGLRWTLFQATSALSNAFAGAAAYGLVQAQTALKPWKLIFIVESTPTFLATILILIIIPSRPDKCIFLSERENEISRERVERGTAVDPNRGINWNHVRAAFLEPWTYLIALIHFMGGIAFNSLSVFLTAIIRDMGYSSINAQGLSAPPYIVAWIFAVCIAFYTDRIQVRGLFIAGAGLVGAIGYLVVAWAGPIGVRYFGVFLAVGGVYVGQPLMYTWCAVNGQSDSKRGSSLVLFSLTGQLGSIVGANIYPTSAGPRYLLGNTLCAGALFISFGSCMIGTFYLRWRNARKDRLYGIPMKNGLIAANADGTDHQDWRFAL